MQQWRDLPQEMTGRRKGAKKADDSGINITVDSSDAAAAAAGTECVEDELFCEACRKWFKSEQQMCVCDYAFVFACVSHSLCMQQHLASKKHREKQLEWEDLLAASSADLGGKNDDDDEGGRSDLADAAPELDDSDEEFEAQLRRMHVGGEQLRDNGACSADGLEEDLDDANAVAAASTDGDEEEEATMSTGKKKKKKKVKKNVFGTTVMLDEKAAEVVPCNGSDEEEGDGEQAPGKKMTKKQIRRRFPVNCTTCFVLFCALIIDSSCRAQEKQKLAEAAAEATAAALRRPDVVSGATARSAPADTAPAVCQVCGAQFLSKTKVC